MSTLGDKLAYYREKRGWTKTYVAKRLGIKTMSTYANWEYNTRQPDNEMLTKLADLYEVTVDELLGRESISKDFEPIPITLFKEGIQQARYRHGLSMLDVCRGTGIDLDTYASYEKSGYIDDEDSKKLEQFYLSLNKENEKSKNKKHDDAEFQAFANNPSLQKWYKELPKSKEEDLERLRMMWEIMNSDRKK